YFPCGLARCSCFTPSRHRGATCLPVDSRAVRAAPVHRGFVCRRGTKGSPPQDRADEEDHFDDVSALGPDERSGGIPALIFTPEGDRTQRFGDKVLVTSAEVPRFSSQRPGGVPRRFGKKRPIG